MKKNLKSVSSLDFRDGKPGYPKVKRCITEGVVSCCKNFLEIKIRVSDEFYDGRTRTTYESADLPYDSITDEFLDELIEKCRQARG